MKSLLMRRASGAVGSALIWLVRLYQASLSPLIGRQCRFIPTCSNYFIEAVRIHGPLKGSLRGIWRVFRCNPLAKGGYDPVPPPGRPGGIPRQGRT